MTYHQMHPFQSATRPDWKSWLEVTVKLFGLPPSTTTYELYKTFSRTGRVVKVELFEDMHARRNGTGSVTFSPPPQRAFWSDESWKFSRTPLDSFQIRMELSPRRTFTHASPLNKEKRYPEKMVLSVGTLEFGLMYEPDEMMSMETIHGTVNRPINMTLNLLRREIIVGFLVSREQPNSTNVTYEKMKFEIPIKILDFIWELDFQDQQRSLVISLDKPPAFFTQLEALKAVRNTHDEGRIWTDRNTWTRQTNIDRKGHERFQQPLTLQNEQCIIDIGRWTTYKINFDGASVDRNLYDQVRRALSDYNVKIIRPERFKTVPRQATSIWTMLFQPGKHMQQASHFSELLNGALYLPWTIRYQLESCISLGCLNERNITPEFLKRLGALPEREALLKLETAADKQERIFDPMEVFDMAIPSTVRARKVPQHCVMQRSATITPTTTYYSTPAVEMSNRILRKYQEYQDRFLRVRFTGEKHEGRIHSASDNSKLPLFNRIFACLRNGIQIGDRHFEFLAAGNSQFREHGAYFFASTPHLTAADIRKGMGKFDKIKVVAKYTSRLGQCFSTTHAIRNMGGNIQAKEFPDVERYKYNFTDGVGKMTKHFACMVASELGLLNAGNPPSVYQFRMGGSKGVVAIDPSITGRHQLHIRESQYKFASTYQGFEIIRWSSYSVPRLNRQLITILKCLKIPAEVFCDKMILEISELKRAMTDETLAIQMLQRQVDFNQMTLEIASIVHDGFLAVQDPFALSVLHLWKSWSLKQLKEKAGLTVQDGAFLLGCTDETSTLVGYFPNLQPGPEAPHEKKVEALPQIFCQISDLSNNGKCKVIEGICIVARNPSLHPGDVRVVNAVDVPQLHHLRDVVVFPQLGRRDIPSMCSGGDLDGDDFVVIWDKALIPPTEKWDVPAMDFTGPTPEQVDEVKIEHIAEFFVHYMQYDTLRTIARFHLANADYLSDGVENARCIELARQHSIAVDYPKSGMPPDPHASLKPEKWPHFMTNEFRAKSKEYHSETVLGLLYDLVPDYNFRPLLDKPFDQRIIKAYSHSKEILRIVQDLKAEYDAALRRIMAQHEIRTEFEIWSTFVMNHSKLEGDYKFHETMGRISTTLKEQFTDVIYELAGGRDFETIAPWVSAMYTVTADEAERVVASLKLVHFDDATTTGELLIDPKDLPLISYPWIFHRELGRMVRDNKASPLPAPKPDVVPPKTKSKMPVHILDQPIEDRIETEDGITHRGEELQLFQDKKENQKPAHDVDNTTHAAMIDASLTGPKEDRIPKPSARHKKHVERGSQLDLWEKTEDQDTSTSESSRSASQSRSQTQIWRSRDEVITTGPNLRMGPGHTLATALAPMCHAAPGSIGHGMSELLQGLSLGSGSSQISLTQHSTGTDDEGTGSSSRDDSEDLLVSTPEAVKVSSPARFMSTKPVVGVYDAAAQGLERNDGLVEENEDETEEVVLDLSEPSAQERLEETDRRVQITYRDKTGA